MGTANKTDELAATDAQGIKGGVEVGVTNYPEERTDADLLINRKSANVEKEDVGITK